MLYYYVRRKVLDPLGHAWETVIFDKGPSVGDLTEEPFQACLSLSLAVRALSR